MYKYLFGPVPSRRLGMSLGVDLVPKKVCSLDCVYCEVGKTTKLTQERMEYIPFKKVEKELEHYFENNPDPDYVTFSGYGEPTLNVRIGEIIAYIKKNKPEISVAVLTNGTLFNNKEVRAELAMADLVLPSLDAAREESFQKINRPVSDLSIHDYIEGLVNFSREFKGEIWLEVFLLEGFNDSPEDLDALRKAFLKIKPERIQLNTLDRPGTEEGLQALTLKRLMEIQSHFGLENIEIIAKVAKRKKLASYRKDTESAILETIARRPCTADDLAQILGLHLHEVNKYLDVLEKDKKISSHREDRGIFYRIQNNEA